MKNISYIKHSDKRAKQFQIKTMIVECDEKKRVIKEACSQEAKQHLYKIPLKCYQKIHTIFANPTSLLYIVMHNAEKRKSNFVFFINRSVLS